MKVVVIGAGVCGLASALALARADHEVVVLERDAPPPPADPTAATQWERPGIPHFLQPHAFLARGVQELRRHAPDVYGSLLDAGAEELRLFEKMPAAPPLPQDDELVFLGCRRPVIEWVLRRHVEAEPNASLRPAVPALGLLWEDEGSAIPRAVGVVTSDGRIDANLVIDGMGRSSPLPHWIVDAGGLVPDEASDDCGIVYYSRYFRFREGHHRPEGPWLIGPRAELGYLETGTFWGDNDTFSLVQQIRADDRALRVLRHPEGYMASLRAQPPFEGLIADEVSEPITPVLPMGRLRNTSRRFVSDGRPVASGVIALGDARCHTNPRYAWGLSLALHQGFLMGDLLRDHGRDLEAVSLAFEEAVAPWTSAAFETATATDDERRRYWGGEAIDPSSPTEALHLFLLLFFPAAGLRDAAIFRAAVRRLMLLDDPRDVEDDRDLLDRGSAIVRDMLGSGSSPQGPPRDELLRLLGAGAKEP